MVCMIKIYENPSLNNPVLVEGLPGIGLVANIAVAYLIKELDARLFGEIKSSYFRDIAFSEEMGLLSHPVNQFYYYSGEKCERDLILLYGNTQALTARGQYELCGHILDVAQNAGCDFVITLGGYKPGRNVTKPRLYFAASDEETAKIARDLGAEPLHIRILGLAGLLIGMSKLRGLKGLCLLSETPGTYPDVKAAHKLLKAFSRIVDIKIDVDNLLEYQDPSELINVIPPFDFGATSKKKEKKKLKPGWLI